MDISIVIPTYNRNDILYKNMAVASAELKGVDCEILIINDSKTNTVVAQKDWPTNTAIINNPKQGVASARNLGASLAKSDNLLFVDDDMVITRKAVERAINFLEQNKDACLNIDWLYPAELNAKLETYHFGRYLEHYGFTSLRGWMGPGFEWKENQMIPVPAASYFLAITKSSFEKTGRYDENFPFAGFEDHDFAIRLQRNNIVTYLDTGMLVWHNEADRVELNGWMQRKYRGGQTRKVAVQAGHDDLILDYNNLKGKIYFILSKIEFILNWALKAIPNNKFFDPLYFKIVNLLLGTNLYKGYTKK